MVLRNTCVVLDDEDVALLKLRHKNISKILRNYIKTELGFIDETEKNTPEQQLQLAKHKISVLSAEIENLNEEKRELINKINKLEKEVERLKPEASKEFILE